MTHAATTLDADELLHVAIAAAGRGDHGEALACLKEGAERFPDDARIAYLLGAEHAQIGLYDRAEAGMARAIQLDPQLYTAVFQLGLLQMTQGRAEAARETWAGLEALPAGHALRCFAEGLVCLAQDQYAQAKALLEQGTQANDFSAELNRDMAGVLERLAAQLEAGGAPAAEAQGHMLLSAYNQDNAPEN